jgi:ribokinase
VILAAAKTAKEKSVTVIVDPAPAQADLPEQFFGCASIVTPNQIEASQLVGFSVTDPATAMDAAQILVKRGVKIAVVKLGASGVVIATEQDCYHQPAFTVNAVDTVAAGDAFNGGLASALAEGMNLQAAALFASAAAACSVTQRGAQTSMPARESVTALLTA